MSLSEFWNSTKKITHEAVRLYFEPITKLFNGKNEEASNKAKPEETSKSKLEL